MILSKKYNLVNNVTGWAMFVIALITYWLTLEPTASYWDCGEFIIQADKLEIGHPPGNPIFMLTARFFANFASDASQVALMVNAMSGLLSALTILLLFWTITHLVRRLIVKDGQTVEPTLRQYLAIMGSGVVGALAYAWSDTFWFSAVEAEVYAFSSFCTALVFWLILKWESRADQPHSDRYLVLIAYVIGVSVAVHLLNLLCIPAIVLVFAYRKFEGMNLKKSLLALLASFGIIVAVLYGLVPGFIKVAQWVELLCVNSLGMSFNSGAVLYAVLIVAVFLWTLWELNSQKSAMRIRISVMLSVALSGMLFIGSSWVIGVILLLALGALLFYKFRRDLPVRVLNVAVWSMFVIFIGYSSYALILIRSNADTPMNQNSPDNVFSLSSYLNREQYGDRPLLYGETPYSEQLQVREEAYDQYIYYTSKIKGAPRYVKGVKGATSIFPSGFASVDDSLYNDKLDKREGDYYALSDYDYDIEMTKELNMVFPRIYSSQHIPQYEYWAGMTKDQMDYKTVSVRDAATGELVPEQEIYVDEEGNERTRANSLPKPTFAQNLRYFFDYQINHMYMRYFMWNFAGRQNDICNQQGEMDAGNWISGIPFIDNARLGDQSLLPDDFGKNNKGHNVFFMLPLLLGLIGLLWQTFAGRRGVEQFWVVFFLFFMTGIAIVLYLNQTPSQPRERDYAFAGSFYAYAIWIGMGVAGLWRAIMWMADKKYANKGKSPASKVAEEEIQLSSITDEPEAKGKLSTWCAIAACVIGLIVPVQMVSQTWDDHDRSDRTAARDYAINYLESLEPNAIIFCNGDNDTFPLWYVQEVEGVRPDVRIINLSYLASDWYANQQRMQAYDSAPVKMLAKPQDYAYDRLTYAQVISTEHAGTPVKLLKSLEHMYSKDAIFKFGTSSIVELKYPNMYIPVDSAAVAKAKVVPEGEVIVDRINVNLLAQNKQYLTLSEILMLDIIATNAANGWERPIYWACTVPNSYHLGLTPYLRSVGMTYQLVPSLPDPTEAIRARTDRGYDVVTKKYRWGGAAANPYFDETAARMLSGVRTSMARLSTELIYEGDLLAASGDTVASAKKYAQALEVLDLLDKNLPQSAKPYSIFGEGMDIARNYALVGIATADEKVQQKGLRIMEDMFKRYAQNIRYYNAMHASFQYPSFTYEVQYAPYHLYQFIMEYESFDGNVEQLMAMPEMAGVDLQQLEQYYNSMLSSASVSESESDTEAQAEQILKEIIDMGVRVSEISKMTAEEYQALSDDDRVNDSTYMFTLQYVGLQPADLQQYDEFKSFDFARSQRLWEEYVSNHPELKEALDGML